MSVEVRDKLAGLEGWTMGHDKAWHWHGNGHARNAHPIPDDLNTCAAMWDKYAGEHGWCWHRGWSGGMAFEWVAELDGELEPSVYLSVSGHDAASELRDRWALLGEVLKARGV